MLKSAIDLELQHQCDGSTYLAFDIAEMATWGINKVGPLKNSGKRGKYCKNCLEWKKKVIWIFLFLGIEHCTLWFQQSQPHSETLKKREDCLAGVAFSWPHNEKLESSTTSTLSHMHYRKRKTHLDSQFDP
jgi:hypothetical protein